MTRTLQEEIAKKRPFDHLEVEAYLNIARSASVLKAPFDRLFKKHGISAAGYNVLRILLGAGDQGTTCTQIGKMLVTNVPDVTRLIDRLTDDNLVERKRETDDRRVVIITITEKGKALAAKIEKPLLDEHTRQLGHMTHAELQTLSRLLEKARNPGT